MYLSVTTRTTKFGKNTLRLWGRFEAIFKTNRSIHTVYQKLVVTAVTVVTHRRRSCRKGQNKEMNRIIIADAIDGLRQIDDESVDTCITSPPYFNLRDYGSENQIGLEKTPEEYIDRLVEVFREVKRVLKSAVREALLRRHLNLKSIRLASFPGAIPVTSSVASATNLMLCPVILLKPPARATILPPSR